mmetsp:Transcript_16409/g.31089  ORF Transcript_16409/g.31089 Transcript_16409/m.31089 type:complete len:903 (-) Transcript_16409:1558-4266(-)
MVVLNKLEEDVTLAMIEEGINLPCSFSFQNYLCGGGDGFDEGRHHDNSESHTVVATTATKTTIYDWNSIVMALGGIEGRVWMGMGMMKTAHAFLNYIDGILKHIQYLKKKKKLNLGAKHHQNDVDVEYDDNYDDGDDSKWVKGLIKRLTKFIISTYERAISECPTVEILWIKFLQHLLYVLHDKETWNDNGGSPDQDDDTPTKKAKLLIQLQNVAMRAVKNCPYSAQLFVFHMQVVLETARVGNGILEPDDIMTIVTQAVNGGFLPTQEAHLEVYLAACQVLQRWILELVSRGTSSFNYDDSERLDAVGGDVGGGTKKKRQRGQDVKVKKYLAPLEDELDQAVDDLVEDLREMYDAAEDFLVKKYSKWTQGRYLLYRERANAEAYVLSPLENDVNRSDEAIKWFEKMVRAHQPSHPNVWRDYISYVIGKAYVELSDKDDKQNLDDQDDVIVEVPGMVVAKFRFVRNLYQRSLSSIKKVDSEDLSSDDLEYMNAMKLLCDEFLQFEKSFGSMNSLDTASKLVAKKLSSIPQKMSIEAETNVTVEGSSEISDTRNESIELKRKRQDKIENLNDEMQSIDESTTKKQKQECGKDDEHIQDAKNNLNVSIGIGAAEHGDIEKQKQTKTLEVETDVVTETKKTEDFKEEKKRGPHIWPIKPKPEHTVKVGNLEYPAHPFTVHVSNLASETMDMDLYDLFHPCGNIVHARIFREKTIGRGRPHDLIPKSKGAGLVQFEERESVEKALALSGEIGIHEKLIVVTRSNQPAVAIVPPGMHRVKSKGEGKNSMRNIKRKERRLRASATSTTTSEEHHATDGSSTMSHIHDDDTNNDQPIGKQDQQVVAQNIDAKDTVGGTTIKKDKTQPTSSTNTATSTTTPIQSSILAFRPRNVPKATPSATIRKKKLGI